MAAGSKFKGSSPLRLKLWLLNENEKDRLAADDSNLHNSTKNCGSLNYYRVIRIAFQLGCNNFVKIRQDAEKNVLTVLLLLMLELVYFWSTKVCHLRLCGDRRRRRRHRRCRLWFVFFSPLSVGGENNFLRATDFLQAYYVRWNFLLRSAVLATVLYD